MKKTIDNTKTLKSPSSLSSSTQQRPNGESHSSNNKNLSELSRTLAWVLRHKAIELGLDMTPDGYVQVQDILDCKHPRLKGKWNLEQIHKVVETNEKKRYRLETIPAMNFKKNRNKEAEGVVDHDIQVLCIRANQGHSLKMVTSDHLLNLLPADQLLSLPMLVHGTNKKAWDSIKTSGLNRMTRNHIHFATGLPQDDNVVSGMRKSCNVYIFINVQKCVDNNIPLFMSDNGVILCPGIHDTGILPPSYFSRVTDSSGLDLI